MSTKFYQSAILIGLTFGLVGCAAKSTGVFRINENDYGITVSEDLVEAKKLSYEGAKEECLRQGKDVLTISFDKVPNVYSVYELKFRCTSESSEKTR